MTAAAEATSYVSRSDRPLQMPAVLGRVVEVDLNKMVCEQIAASEDLETLAKYLRQLLSGGFAVWEDGTLTETRVRVALLEHLRIEIHTREHGPPHFHVSASDLEATFSSNDASFYQAR